MAELAPGADADLVEIARYTARTWGLDQAESYLGKLEEHFLALSAGTALERAAFEHRADLRVSRCQHHHVFFTRDEELGVIILAVLHENMNLLVRLRQRLVLGDDEG